MQIKLFDEIDNQPKKFDLPEADITYHPSFYDNSQSNNYFNELLKKIEWQQDKMNIHGKDVQLPRLTAWYGDNNKDYSFSGITLQPKDWLPELLQIKTDIEKLVSLTFNSVLLNLYRSGQDSISWHTDAEKELGKNPLIASVSFGETRRFQLKHKYKKELGVTNIDLTDGSLLVMQGTTQHYWLHQIPKSKKQLKERINLTFRIIK